MKVASILSDVISAFHDMSIGNSATPKPDFDEAAAALSMMKQRAQEIW